MEPLRLKIKRKTQNLLNFINERVYIFIGLRYKGFLKKKRVKHVKSKGEGEPDSNCTNGELHMCERYG